MEKLEMRTWDKLSEGMFNLLMKKGLTELQVLEMNINDYTKLVCVKNLDMKSKEQLSRILFVLKENLIDNKIAA